MYEAKKAVILGNGNSNVRAKNEVSHTKNESSSTKGKPQDIVLVENSEGVLEVPKETKIQNNTNIKPISSNSGKKPMRDVTNSAKEDKSGGITYTIKVIPKEDSKVNPEIIEKSTIEATKIQTEEIVLKKPVKNDYKENNSFESNYSNNKEKSFNYKSSGGNENLKNTEYSSGLGDLKYTETPLTSNKIGSKNVNKHSQTLNTPPEVSKDVKTVMRGEDSSGRITEKVFNTAFEKDPNITVYEGKYDSNNGFDHVIKDEKTGEVWILESKQLSNKGTVNLSNKGVGGTRQLSSEWVKGVMDKLGEEHPTVKLIKEADKQKKLRTGITVIDKDTGELKIVPVIIKNK